MDAPRRLGSGLFPALALTALTLAPLSSCSSPDSDAVADASSASSGGGGAGDVTCEVVENQPAGACSCLPDAYHALPPSALECTIDSPAHSRCCASETYPADGRCSCYAWGCDETADYCGCGELNVGTSGTCQNTWMYCCGNDFGSGALVTCRCTNDSPCDPDELVVPSCGVEVARSACTSDGIPVTSCSEP